MQDHVVISLPKKQVSGVRFQNNNPKLHPSIRLWIISFKVYHPPQNFPEVGSPSTRVAAGYPGTNITQFRALVITLLA